jgi:hypothetical protein
VKTKQEETAGIHTELWMMMKDRWRSLMGSCSSNYISDDKLGQLLKQWGEPVALHIDPELLWALRRYRKTCSSSRKKRLNTRWKTTVAMCQPQRAVHHPQRGHCRHGRPRSAPGRRKHSAH